MPDPQQERPPTAADLLGLKSAGHGSVDITSILDTIRGLLGIGPSDPSMEEFNTAGQIGGLTLGMAPPAMKLVKGARALMDPELRSIGKPVSEMLDVMLNPKPGAGLPKRLRVTGWDARNSELAMTPVEHKAAVGNSVRVSPQDLDKLLGAEAVGIEQPPARDVETIRRKIAAALDTPESRHDLFKKYAGNPEHYPDTTDFPKKR